MCSGHNLQVSGSNRKERERQGAAGNNNIATCPTQATTTGQKGNETNTGWLNKPVNVRELHYYYYYFYIRGVK
jgi:hypothetical protein